MSYSSAEGRQELLDTLAEAVDELSYALAALGAAYEQLDQGTADRLEDELFGPAQRAYGRSQRTYTAFAGRHGLTTRPFEQVAAGLPSTGAKGFLENATAAVQTAGSRLAAVQDSPKLIEVGDAELRAGLTEIRELLADLPGAGREIVRRLGR